MRSVKSWILICEVSKVADAEIEAMMKKVKNIMIKSETPVDPVEVPQLRKKEAPKPKENKPPQPLPFMDFSLCAVSTIVSVP